MSNGNLNKQPKLSSKAPTLNVPETLERLNALEEWSEQPARVAADAIKHEQVVRPKSVKENAPKVKVGEGTYPWEDGVNGVVSVNFKLPANLFAKLKYIAETTYGSNMTKIVIEALEPKVDKMLKERGIKV